MQNDRIVVLPVHEVSGMQSLAEGNIDFRGDIVIHGMWRAASTSGQTGSITIDGVAEACMLEAGKDIILRGGMLGGNKGVCEDEGRDYCEVFLSSRTFCVRVICRRMC